MAFTHSHSRLYRWLAMVISTTLSLGVAWTAYAWLIPDQPRIAPTNDYSLTFIDTSGRPISEHDGSLRLVIDPFTIYRNAPNQKTSSFTIDENGFRNADLNRPGERVFLVGSSAAFGQDLKRDAETLSDQLNLRLPEMNVLNAGVVGYLSGQELALVVHYLDHFQPAGYVLLDGWNELFDAFHYNRRPEGRCGYNNTFFDVENRLHAYRCQLKAIPPTPASTGTTDPVEVCFDRVVQAYLENVDRMKAFVTARGAFFLLVLQPESASSRVLTEEEKEDLEGWNKAYGYLDQGFPDRYREFCRRVAEHAKASGIDCVVVADNEEFRHDPNPLFLDPVHLTAAGNRRLAELISTELRTRVIPQVGRHENERCRNRCAKLASHPLSNLQNMR